MDFKLNKLTLLIFVLSCFLFAQKSDYEINQDFKKQLHNYSMQADTTNNLEELESLRENVIILKAKFKKHEEILYSALYPDTYDEKFKKLDQKVAEAIKKATQKVELEEKLEVEHQEKEELTKTVAALNSKIEILDGENKNLLSRIGRIEASRTKDKKQIAELKKLVEELKDNILRRDNLVYSMVDSLFNEFEKSDLDGVEEKKLLMSFDNSKIFYIIQNTIDDNIKFIRSTDLSLESVQFMKDENARFKSIWKKISPKLIKAYLNDNQDAQIVKDIENKISIWARVIDKEAFRNLHLCLVQYDLAVKPFDNGSSMHSNIIQYIEDQINNTNQDDSKTLERNYTVFKDSVWDGRLEKGWLDYFTSKGLLSDIQKNDLEAKVSQWDEQHGMNDMIIYGGIAGVVLVVLIVLFAVIRKKKNSKDEFEDFEFNSKNVQANKTIEVDKTDKEDIAEKK